MPLGPIGGGPGGVQLAHQPVAFGLQRPAVFRASGIQLRSKDVEVTVYAHQASHVRPIAVAKSLPTSMRPIKSGSTDRQARRPVSLATLHFPPAFHSL